MDVTSIYEQVLGLSRQMLETGMAQNWDTLIDLEAQRHNLLQKTVGHPISPAIAPLIHEIKASDAVLLEKIEAWMGDVKILLRMRDS